MFELLDPSQHVHENEILKINNNKLKDEVISVSELADVAHRQISRTSMKSLKIWQ